MLFLESSTIFDYSVISFISLCVFLEIIDSTRLSSSIEKIPLSFAKDRHSIAQVLYDRFNLLSISLITV